MDLPHSLSDSIPSILIFTPSEMSLFKEALPELTRRVLAGYEKHPELSLVLGNNVVETLRKGQEFFSLTLLAVAAYGNPRLQIKLLPWVYRSYQRHGFHHRYFQITLQLWEAELAEMFPRAPFAALTEFISWMHSAHDYVLDLASQVPPGLQDDPEMTEETRDQCFQLLESLLHNDTKVSYPVLRELFESRGSGLYTAVLEPVLYEVGRLWELGKITVLQEHQIVAQISGFMSEVGPAFPLNAEKRILISPAPNEFHEVGAMMVADFFRTDNWQVEYLSAGSPDELILRTIAGFKPHIIAFSIISILHAVKLQDLVTTVGSQYPCIPIILGGKFIRENPEIPDLLKVGGWASTPKDAVDLANALYVPE